MIYELLIDTSPDADKHDRIDIYSEHYQHTIPSKLGDATRGLSSVLRVCRPMSVDAMKYIYANVVVMVTFFPVHYPPSVLPDSDQVETLRLWPFVRCLHLRVKMESIDLYGRPTLRKLKTLVRRLREARRLTNLEITLDFWGGQTPRCFGELLSELKYLRATGTVNVKLDGVEARHEEYVEQARWLERVIGSDGRKL